MVSQAHSTQPTRPQWPQLRRIRRLGLWWETGSTTTSRGAVELKLDEGKSLECQALLAQCMKGTHQACLDNGSWKLGWHLTGLVEPMSRPRFGGSERELEAVAAYTRAIEDLEQRIERVLHLQFLLFMIY